MRASVCYLGATPLFAYFVVYESADLLDQTKVFVAESG